MPLILKPISASWTSTEQVLIFLSHDWLDEEALPQLYFNSIERPIGNLKPAPLSLFGQLTGYFKEGDAITFLCDWNEEMDTKKIFVAGSFNNWGEAIWQEAWRLQVREIEGQKFLTLTVPWAEHLGESALFKFVTEEGIWLPVNPEAPNFELDTHNNSNYRIDLHSTGRNAFIFNPLEAYDPAINYQILWIDEGGTHSHLIEDTAVLLKLYSEKALGAIVNNESTTFRIFAPRAKKLCVTFYDKLETSSISLDLHRNADYTWELQYPKNLHGWYYYYSLLDNNPNIESNPDLNAFNFKVLDPYALAAVGPGGPGIIIDQKQIPKIKTNFEVPQPIDLIILEAHLRDLLVNTQFGAYFHQPIGFRNLIAWLNNNNNYLKNFGVNALELLPVLEFESESPLQYHWGYMTNHFFCLSNSYASEEGGVEKIGEFQDTIKAFHKQGIAVILDVVYNHSGSPNHLLHIDRDYYFELTKQGVLMNVSGCGNDFRANTPMGKRLIIDSLTHLVKTYDIDGFRFDLAELLGVEVLKEIESALKAIKPSIILIAEPWSFRGHIAHALKETGFSSWNDGYREFIANFVLGTSNAEAFMYYIKGSTDYLTRFTAQSINYAASHDDYCWLDRITENPDHNGNDPTVHDIRRTHLMIAILMMSVGVPMLAEGQDMLHSKKGHSNTYQREDLNALDYTNKVNYSATHQYFTRWISLRLSQIGEAVRMTQMPGPGYFKFYNKPGTSVVGVLYNADRSLKNVKQLFFVVNPYLTVEKLHTEDLDLKNFTQLADHERIELNGLESALILSENNEITMPPLGCGLWVEKF